MVKKLSAILVVLTMLVSMFGTVSFANEAESIVFYNAENDEQTTAFAQNSENYATISFMPEKSGKANVYVAHYNESGKLVKGEIIGDFDITAGVQASYTTPDFSVGSADNVKLFVWDTSMTPLTKECEASVQAAGDSTVEVENNNGVLAESTSISSDGASADVPAGVALDEGASALTLSVTGVDESESDVELEENEELTAYDVHIDGVSSDNQVPIVVTIDSMTLNGLNQGNIDLYHVEDGTTNQMTQVMSADDLDEHNTYYYNPEDGTVSVAIASFSEIAAVSDTTAAWNGNTDYSWYDADKEELTISNADQLDGFAKIVGGMDGQTRDSFEGKTVKLTADINLNDGREANKEELLFNPIGYYYNADSAGDGTNVPDSTVKSFEGIFDGNGHKVSNFYQNTWEMKGDYGSGNYKDGMGLFGYVVDGTIKNLSVDNFSSDGEYTPTGVIAAYAVNSDFTNIAITNCNPGVYNTGNGGIVGIGGNSDDTSDKEMNFTNITVDNTNKITALWGSWDVACGGIMGMFRGYSKVNFTNCHVAAQIDVYNDVCGNYQYYWYRYSGMVIGSLRGRNTTDADGYTVPDMTDITASECTVHFGEWNDYYYCELVANSLASYTHDHQFSRLTQIESLDEIKSGETWTKAGNFLLIDGDTKTCYHIVKADDGTLYQHNHEDSGEETVNGETVLKEDKQIVYLPFNQLFQGDGWGVKHIPIYNGEAYAFDGITILDRKVADSVVKFNWAKDDNTITTDTTVTVGDLFAEATGADVDIDTDNVQVTVSPVGDDSTVSATYTPDTTDWTKGTISFTGLGDATITITDYYFCTPTTINITVAEPVAVDKFVAKDITEVDADGTAITFDELFAAVNGASINSSAVMVDVSGVAADVVYNTSDWTQGTLTFTGVGTATITITDNDYCNPATLNVVVNAVDKFTSRFANADFLYRIGSADGSTVAFATIFDADASMTVDDASVDVKFVTIAGNADATRTENISDWTTREIQFTGTGVIQVNISDACSNVFSVKFEVVDAKNITTATSATENNVVLLNDISNSSFSVSGNHTFYGNGFTVTLPTSHTSKYTSGFTGFINLDSGNLDNVKIVGTVYPEQYLYREQAGNETDGCTYFRNAVIINSGNCRISNSYISGTRAAVYVKGGNDIVFDNTTVEGGAYANVEISVADSVTFKDFTSIQKETENSYDVEDSSGNNKKVIGLGVVVDNGSTEIYIEGALNQYNWINESNWEAMLGDYVNSFPKLFTASEYESYRHYLADDSSTPYVNLTFIFACTWDSTKIHDNRTDKTITYSPADASVGGESGGVYSVTDMGTLTDSMFTPGAYASSAYYHIEPDLDFDYTVKNYEAKTEGSDTYCYHDGEKVQISVEENGEKVWDTSILTLTKYGHTDIPYTVTMNGTDYTGGSITFNEGGEYDVVYSYTDDYNYKLDENGNLLQYSVDYTKTVTIKVNVATPQAKNAVFTFGGDSDSKSAEKILVANDIYLSASGVDASTLTNSVSATFATSESGASSQTINYDDEGAWGSTTIDGNTFYFPIADMLTTDKTFKHYSSWYGCFPVFSGVVTITDYANGGTGSEEVYDSSTTDMPANLEAIYPQPTFRYQGTLSKVPTEPSVPEKGNYTDKLCYTTQTDLSASNERDEEWVLAKYKYTDNAGETYYYFVGYYCAASTDGTCVTPETLITLADGSQKEVQYLTGDEMLLVWNHTTGEYDTAPVAYIVDHDEVEEEREVTTLTFADGNEVEIIGEHVFFDVTQNKYVSLDSNAEAYIGHEFAVLGEDTLATAELVKAETETRVTKAYEVVTYKHMTCFTENVLSASAFMDKLLNVFDIDADTYAYNPEKMADDIETYGLYTYEDFEGIVPEKAFELYNAAYLKIAVGKGYITWDDILALVEVYDNLEIVPLNQ